MVGAKRALIQLHLDYTDGTSEILVSDEQWRTCHGPITSSCLYEGKRYDARLEQPGWDAGRPVAYMPSMREWPWSRRVKAPAITRSPGIR